MAKEQHRLSNIKIIPFLEALDAGDRSILGVTQETFTRLASEYIKATKKRPNNFEVRLEDAERKVFLITSCLFVLSIDIADPEMMRVLTENGFEMRHDYYFDDLEKAKHGLKILKFKRDNLKDQVPKKKKRKAPKKDDEDSNIFSILTSLATGLEMHLDFQSMVVSEFVSWRKQLDLKVEHMKKHKPKK